MSHVGLDGRPPANGMFFEIGSGWVDLWLDIYHRHLQLFYLELGHLDLQLLVVTTSAYNLGGGQINHNSKPAQKNWVFPGRCWCIPNTFHTWHMNLSGDSGSINNFHTTGKGALCHVNFTSGSSTFSALRKQIQVRLGFLCSRIIIFFILFAGKQELEQQQQQHSTLLWFLLLPFWSLYK